MFLERMYVDSQLVDEDNYKRVLADARHDALRSFLDEWFSDSDLIELQTSGSTGAPKKIFVEKQKMKNSARMTCSHLGLEESMSALLAMPLKYIGAKMVVVRALCVGMQLKSVEPSMNPMKDLDGPVDFAALTPAQAESCLKDPRQAELFSGCGRIILGGGAVSRQLEEKLQKVQACVWSTYGMTETVSHIALRRLNGPRAEDRLRPLEGVTVGLSKEGTLFINAPHLADGIVCTNDIAEVSDDGSFRILGRSDNVVNSGGVKIQIEAVEEALSSVLPMDFAVAGAADPTYGEVCVLLVEGSSTTLRHDSTEFQILDRYARPKRIFVVGSLPKTGSGKPDRARARELASKLIGENI